MASKDHWEKVYSSKAADTVSWYQPHAQVSLRLITAAAESGRARIIDVGGGASTLVDDLLAAGFADISVLDLSEAALQAARTRLGAGAAAVTWIAGDITTVELPADCYDIWHDRAVFHFLVEPQARAAYRKTLMRALKAGGHLILATFAEDGPEKCSGLPVKRYSAAELAAEIGPGFALDHAEREQHVTPSGAVQHFTYCSFRKLA